MQTAPHFRVKRYQMPNARAAQRFTVDLVAKAIRDSSSYLPIRNLAASIATRARPKDYFGQVKAIYDDFVQRWRYVKDPVGVETLAASPRAIFYLVLNGNGQGTGGGLGAGDCDDAACGVGSMLAAIGMPVRIVTSRNPRATRGLFSHIFVQTLVPGHGWISIDPVGHPLHGFAWTPPHSAIAIWDINGQQIAGDDLLGDASGEGSTMLHGYGFLGSSDDYKWDETPLPFEVGEPLPWDVYGLAGFGDYADSMGYIPDGRGYMIEVDESNRYGDSDYYRTPMLEMSPGAFELANRFGVVLDRTLALGDDGSVYQYDGLAGFFKKLIHRAKKIVKKVGKRIIRGGERLLKKTKFGRGIIKLKNKIIGVAMKLVKPLLKIVGKWATKLAPIAAMIPGFGTVVAGYLTAAGTAAKLLDKHGVEFVEMMQTGKHGKKKKVRKLKGKPKDILAYKKDLEREARRAKKLPKKKLKAGAAKMKAFKGKRLPREDLTNKTVLKKGSSEWVTAMRTLGIRGPAKQGREINAGKARVVSRRDRRAA